MATNEKKKSFQNRRVNKVCLIEEAKVECVPIKKLFWHFPLQKIFELHMKIAS